MNWYEGNIAEAVAQSKSKNAIFVVYIEGKDESTQKLTRFINEQRIRSKLESDDFVAIKIESDSQAYMQFATIYQVVPVPSLFFIGKSGTPLEIGTGVIESADELEQKIEKVLAASGRSSASSSFINAEKSAESVQSAESAQPSKSINVANSTKENEEVVCDGDVCYKKTPSSEVSSTPLKDEEAKSTAEAPSEVTDANVRIEETRKLLEQKRRERVEAEKQLEKDRELRRRAEGKQTQNMQQWQKEQELKELKDNIRRERMEEQAARERIRAQIAADRAERAQKFAVEAEPVANAASSSATKSPSPNANSDTARLQFRFSNGDSAMHNFNCQETLATIRAYVKEELLPNTGIKTFVLSTTYPKRELTTELDAKTLTELGLFPSAVILVIGKEGISGPSAMIARSGGLFNMLTTLFWTMLSPVLNVIGYFKKMGGGGIESGAAKRGNEDRAVQHDAAKRRNLERFSAAGSGNSVGTGPSTSKDTAEDTGEDGEQKPYRRFGGSNIHRLSDNRKDSDDENATWNGNSTQQQ